MEPRPRGGFRHGKLKPHREFILGFVQRQPDITMPNWHRKLLASKGVNIYPSNLSRFLIAKGSASKKMLRATEQDRPDLVRARLNGRDTRQPLMGQQRDRLIFIDWQEPCTQNDPVARAGLEGNHEQQGSFGHRGTQTFVTGSGRHGLAAPGVIDAPMNRVHPPRPMSATSSPPSSSPATSSFSTIFQATKANAQKDLSGNAGPGCCSCRPTALISNPIEMSFSNLKARLRAAAARTIDDL